MEKRIINYNMIRWIVDYVIGWYGNIDIESSFGREKIESTGIGFGRREIESIAAVYDMGVDDVLNKIVETLEETPINENGDCLSWQWGETPDEYVLHVKLYDEDEEED